MANKTGKTHPSAKDLHRPNLRPARGNSHDPSRSHIVSGPQRDPKPARS
jgi:hypothetical protein